MSLALSGALGEAWQKKVAWLKQFSEGQVFITQQQWKPDRTGPSWVGRLALAP